MTTKLIMCLKSTPRNDLRTPLKAHTLNTTLLGTDCVISLFLEYYAMYWSNLWWKDRRLFTEQLCQILHKTKL